MNPCKGWILKIGRLYPKLNIMEYVFTEKFFTDYSEMKRYKEYLQTEKEHHNTIIEENVVWE